MDRNTDNCPDLLHLTFSESGFGLALSVNDLNVKGCPHRIGTYKDASRAHWDKSLSISEIERWEDSLFRNNNEMQSKKQPNGKSKAIHQMLAISQFITEMPVIPSPLMHILTAVSFGYPKGRVGTFPFSQREELVLNNINKSLSVTASWYLLHKISSTDAEKPVLLN